MSFSSARVFNIVLAKLTHVPFLKLEHLHHLPPPYLDRFIFAYHEMSHCDISITVFPSHRQSMSHIWGGPLIHLRAFQLLSTPLSRFSNLLIQFSSQKMKDRAKWSIQLKLINYQSTPTLHLLLQSLYTIKLHHEVYRRHRRRCHPCFISIRR